MTDHHLGAREEGGKRLTKTQRAILRSAAEHPQGYVVAYAPTSAILVGRELLVHDGYHLTITPAGREAVAEEQAKAIGRALVGWFSGGRS